MDSSKATQFLGAVQDLRGCASDEELRGGEVAYTSLGLPMLWSGNFADVYKIHCPATGNTWALKCFTRAITGRQERYRHIAAQLEAAGLPFTVPFVYLEQGIQIRGQWYPAVKMQWVEGQTLNRFVEESLDKPLMLRQLLDLWPKLAARLRRAGIAHADLQHGNVLLVPMPDGKLALKLIDYDGMWVASLAGTPSGELGHPAYQHPQRLRQGIYSAHVDRFSHLVIYTAVHALATGHGELWHRFNNDENLLFREGDFQAPEKSELLQALWETNSPSVRGLVGRLIRACGQRLEEVPWLDEVVVKGQVRALTRKEESRVAEILGVEKTTAAVPDKVAATATGTESPPAIPDEVAEETIYPLADLDEYVHPSNTRPVAIEGTRPVTQLHNRRAQARKKSLLARAAATANALDGIFRGLVDDNDFLRCVLWAVLLLLLPAAVWLATNTFWQTARSRQITQHPPAVSATELKLRAIAPQTVEAGKSLTVAVEVENPDAWHGKLRHGFVGQAPPGASIDPQSGNFSWTPPLDQAGGRYDVRVSVTSLDGRNDETSFAVNVFRPVPSLRLQPVAPQTIEVGKPLNALVTVENFDAWKGKVHYSLGSQPPPRASIDPQSGEFSWTPPLDQAAGRYDVTVSAQGPDGQTAQTTFVVTLTRPTLPVNKEIAVDLAPGVKLEMVLIPAGEFLMGSPAWDNNARADEKPQHRVRITKPFCLGKYKVTQEQWAAVMGSNPSHFNGPKNPVEQVSWDDCQAFLGKLNETTAGQGDKFALPTETQWEYACRAGSTTRYYFGEEEGQLGEYAWYDKNSGGQTHRVGEKKPNAWGLYDMHGNVWEWCADWYGDDYYGKSPPDDPTGPSEGSYRVLRGGSWCYPAGPCRSAVRNFFAPGIRDYFPGFRVLRVPGDK